MYSEYLSQTDVEPLTDAEIGLVVRERRYMRLLIPLADMMLFFKGYMQILSNDLPTNSWEIEYGFDCEQKVFSSVYGHPSFKPVPLGHPIPTIPMGLAVKSHEWLRAINSVEDGAEKFMAALPDVVRNDIVTYVKREC